MEERAGRTGAARLEDRDAFRPLPWLGDRIGGPPEGDGIVVRGSPSGRRPDGGERREERQAQQEISTKTHRTVERFAEENDRLLERMGAAREDFLDALRAEAGRVRRWTVPALSAALVLAVPSFAAMGGYAQSQFGVFDAYDDTNGWKRFVWDRHGERVRACLLRSEQTGKVLACGLRVDGRGLFREPATRLPPLPSRG